MHDYSSFDYVVQFLLKILSDPDPLPEQRQSLKRWQKHIDNRFILHAHIFETTSNALLRSKVLNVMLQKLSFSSFYSLIFECFISNIFPYSKSGSVGRGWSYQYTSPYLFSFEMAGGTVVRNVLHPYTIIFMTHLRNFKDSERTGTRCSSDCITFNNIYTSSHKLRVITESHEITTKKCMLHYK